MRARPVPVTVRAVAVAAAAVLLAGCSGSDKAAPPAPAPKTSGPCDAAALATHAGVAAGAVRTYVWKPFQAGTLGPKAKAAARKVALARATAAAARAAKELSAPEVVEGCPTDVSVTSALLTGKALALSVQKQLSKGTVNAQAIGGLNSAVTTIVEQAKQSGATVKITVPTPAELAAG